MLIPAKVRTNTSVAGFHSLTHTISLLVNLFSFLLPERRSQSGGEINTPLLWTGLDSLYYFDPNINGFIDSVYLNASETHYVL